MLFRSLTSFLMDHEDEHGAEDEGVCGLPTHTHGSSWTDNSREGLEQLAGQGHTHPLTAAV